MPGVGVWVILSGKKRPGRGEGKGERVEVAACETLSVKEEAKDP